jgi:hypothetical protein
MSTPEFKILLDEKNVKGEYGLLGVQPQPAGEGTIVLDQLTLHTVELMNRWLCFWDLILDSPAGCGWTPSRKENLLQPSTTLKVLGEQLWRLILDNDVGEALKRQIPEEGKPPIRLSIEFHDKADATLKGLPWEFLYEPENGWFLAAKTELLLTRYVSTPKERARVAQVGDKDKLRVLPIAALPGGKKFAPHREGLRDLSTALRDVTNLEVEEPIDVWDPDKIRNALKAKEYHIVHVVGICRGTPGNPQIYLGGQNGGFQDPDQFVNCLTEHMPRPRLVILQLCDYEDGDASENFERLAPDLIKRRVPAVLALQYAAKADQADHIGLGKQFYESLVGGEHIGAAVQASRRRLHNECLDRRFGTPVLYLQEDGALRRPGSGAGVGESTARSGASAGQTIRATLIDLVEREGNRQRLEGDEIRPLLLWVVDLDPNIGPTEVKNLVSQKLLDHLDETSKKVFTEMFMALGRLERGR